MAIDFKKSYPVIEWDLNNYHFFTKYFGKKEENSRGFKVQILQDGEVLTPTTETLRIYCKKKDGTIVYINSSSIVDNHYIINLTNQVFAIEGLVECELQLNSGGIWRCSPTFGINVDKNLVDGSILSSNDFIALQDALSKVDNFDDLYASRLNAVEANKVDKANIVNNGITTVAGTVLDGRMGKTLTDNIDTLNNNLADIKNISYLFPESVTKTIKASTDIFTALLLCRVVLSDEDTADAIYMLTKLATGYTHIIPIKASTWVVATDDNTAGATDFVFTPTYTTFVQLLILRGSATID